MGIGTVKLWDPATGKVVGLMEVSRGFRLWGQGRSIEAGWVKRIVGHLKAQHPDGSPVAAPNGFWRSTIELGWLEKVLPGPKPPDPGN